MTAATPLFLLPAPRNEREALTQIAATLAQPTDADRRWASARACVRAAMNATGWAGEVIDLAPMADVHTRRYPRTLEEAFPTPEWRRGIYGPYRKEGGHARAILIVVLVLSIFLAWGVWA
ncbi:MAG: hypothetical protein EPN34_03135 [Burkholderiaceae bacterium]|nr:MAG: hypothetical protein EPN34_03135 [Burkholderiaceae bacterium]